MPEQPLLSIVIATYNGRAKIERCLRSVLPQASTSGVQTLVVVDGSTDGTSKLLRELASSNAGLRAYDTAHAGLAAARNEGARQSDGRWLFFLDDDACLPAGFVDQVLAVLQQPPADVVGFWDGPLASDSYLARSLRYVELASRLTLERRLAPKGVALACRREHFQQLGGFQAHRDYYQREDSDFLERAREQGLTDAYLRTPAVEHESPGPAEYVAKAGRSLLSMPDATDAHYFRIKETLALLVAGGLFLIALRRPPLRLPLLSGAGLGGLGLCLSIAKLASAPLASVPGIAFALGLRLPFLLLGTGLYVVKAARRNLSRQSR